MVWQVTCVDTMKDSRDHCAPGNRRSNADIAQGVALCAGMNVTHITVNVFYDYADYMATWVSIVRAAGKAVWFRCHWNHWEGNNGAAADMTPTSYISSTQAFILANPSLFQSGDIFDFCPEPENSPWWNANYGGATLGSSTPNAATDAYNQFHLDGHNLIQATFNSIGIFGVTTGIHSTNGFFATHEGSLYLSTTAALGYVTVDDYPELTSTTPSVCAAARLSELQQIASLRRGVPIVIGELGYSNQVNVDDTTQYNVLSAEFDAIATVPQIYGMNYWVGQGSATAGGYTYLFSGGIGNYAYRPAALLVAAFYAQQLEGSTECVVNLAGVDLDVLPVNGSEVGLFVESGSIDVSLAIGQRSTADFQVVDEAGAQEYEQGTPVSITDPVSGTVIFGGVVDTSDETDIAADALTHDIACADWHYLADKRKVAYAATNKSAGGIFSDIVAAKLAAEGVIIQRGVNLFSAQQSSIEGDVLGVFKAGGGVTLTRDQTAGTIQDGASSLKAVTDGTGGFQSVSASAPSSLFVPGAQYTFSVYMKAASGTPTVRLFCEGNDFLTGNHAIGTPGNITLSTTKTRYTVTVTMPNPIVDSIIGLRMDTGSTPQAITMWFDAWQAEAGASATAFELGGLQPSVQAGPTIGEFTSNYDTCASCFDALARASNFYWQLDQNKVAWFVAPGTVQAPWAATPDDMELGSVKLRRANPAYRNAQYVLGATDQTTTQVEVRIGDGNTQSWTMAYPLASTPTVEVLLSGGAYVAKTVGVGGVDSGKDFYWNENKNVVFQDPAGTKLRGPTGTVDNLRVTYVGQFPVVVYSTNDAEITNQLAREGAGTGIVEDLVVDGSLSTRAGAFQVAGGYIQKFGQLGRRLTFLTYRGGLLPGQMLTVTYPKHKLTNQPMLIESVRVTHNGVRYVYQVAALTGPANNTWVQFFQMLANQSAAVIDRINLGSGNTVTTLQSFTATKAPSAAFTATVNACVFPSATAYPSATTYPC